MHNAHMPGLCLYIGLGIPKLFALNFHFDVILMPHNTHSWKKTQTRLCFFSGLLCYFSPVHMQVLFFLHFDVKIGHIRWMRGRPYITQYKLGSRENPPPHITNFIIYGQPLNRHPISLRGGPTCFLIVFTLF